MSSAKDDDGQPLNPGINRHLRSARDIDELLGICRGLAADQRINQLEAQFIYDWLVRSAEARDEWPGDLLFSRLESILRDGRLDPDEEGELLGLLIKITGGDPKHVSAANLAAGLPLSEPAPEVVFPQRCFCFTGKFILGTRSECEREVITRGGDVSASVAAKLDYLVIGVVGSRDWIHSSFGRKIEKAVALRDSGSSIAIVGEQHFVSSLRMRV